jgi:hypothetical protein
MKHCFSNQPLRTKMEKSNLGLPNPDEGLVLNVLPDLMSFTLDIIALIAFGYDLNSLESKSPELAES